MAIGYCSALRCGPSRGIVSSSCEPSRHAHSGSKLAIDAERRESRPVLRDAPAGCGRSPADGRRGPLSCAACSMASSAIRTPPSPMAWMWIWKPSASKARTASFRPSADQFGKPHVCGASSYGSSRKPVPASMTPSAKNFTVRRRQPRRCRVVRFEVATCLEEPAALPRPRAGIGPERRVDSAGQQPTACAVGVHGELVESRRSRPAPRRCPPSSGHASPSIKPRSRVARVTGGMCVSTRSIAPCSSSIPTGRRSPWRTMVPSSGSGVEPSRPPSASAAVLAHSAW